MREGRCEPPQRATYHPQRGTMSTTIAIFDPNRYRSPAPTRRWVDPNTLPGDELAPLLSFYDVDYVVAAVAAKCDTLTAMAGLESSVTRAKRQMARQMWADFPHRDEKSGMWLPSPAVVEVRPRGRSFREAAVPDEYANSLAAFLSRQRDRRYWEDFTLWYVPFTSQVQALTRQIGSGSDLWPVVKACGHLTRRRPRNSDVLVWADETYTTTAYLKTEFLRRLFSAFVAREPAAVRVLPILLAAPRQPRREVLIPFIPRTRQE